MKLIDVLVDAGDATLLFGVHTKYLAMDPDGRVYGYTEMPTPGIIGWSVPDNLYSTDGRGCLIQIDRDDVDGQWQSAIVTREQYESALAAKNYGWIEWGGGECPVPCGTAVDIKHRCGAVSENQQAWPKHHKESDVVVNPSSNAGQAFWRHENSVADIIAYRLHQPQEVTEADDEADLNECIGHPPATAWNGEGLPPVGCECEYSLNGGKTWWKCKIDYIVGTQGVVMLCDTFEGVQYVQFSSYGNALKFRPIRSEADKKRDAAIEFIAGAIDSHGIDPLKSAVFIYDAIAAGGMPGVKLED